MAEILSKEFSIKIISKQDLIAKALKMENDLGEEI